MMEWMTIPTMFRFWVTVALATEVGVMDCGSRCRAQLLLNAERSGGRFHVESNRMIREQDLDG